jgi:hypothetical protein
VQRIVAGSGDQAEDLPGLVVVDRHGARLPAQRLIGHAVVIGVDGEVEAVAPLGAEGPAQQVVARELVGKGVEGAGADVALQIPHHVERGLADGLVVVIGAPAVDHGGEHVPVPVQHGAAGQFARRCCRGGG